MREFYFRDKKSYISKGIVMVILIFAVVLIGTGCHKKIGVKSGGELKPDKSKCKCKKKKGGVYGCFHYPNDKVLQCEY